MSDHAVATDDADPTQEEDHPPSDDQEKPLDVSQVENI